jgi:2'-5' RNA ligase
MRAFVAVFPPSEVRREALAWARRWSSDDRVRWTRPENVHLTLKFPGGDIRAKPWTHPRCMEEACAQYASFDTALAELGAFLRRGVQGS